MGVATVLAESSCCIAASYEAKALGVKTGTLVRDARVMCPGIAIVQAKPPEYLRFHHQVVAAVEDCIHVEVVLSIDEMWAWLPLNLREPEVIQRIAEQIKATVVRDVSPVIKVSIGVGPNRYLAKAASKMRKPDGLFFIHHAALPDILHPLKLRDLNGIGKSMETRMHASGIRTLGIGSSDLQEVSAEALGKLGDARAVKELIRALGNKSPKVCKAAAKALGELGDASAVDPLIMARGQARGRSCRQRTLRRAVGHQHLESYLRKRRFPASNLDDDPVVEISKVIRSRTKLETQVRGDFQSALPVLKDMPERPVRAVRQNRTLRSGLLEWRTLRLSCLPRPQNCPGSRRNDCSQSPLR